MLRGRLLAASGQPAQHHRASRSRLQPFRVILSRWASGAEVVARQNFVGRGVSVEVAGRGTRATQGPLKGHYKGHSRATQGPLEKTSISDNPPFKT